MKYYIYISVPKVEMLFPQIPAALLQGVSTEWKVNLGLVSTTLKGAPLKPIEGLSAQLAAVSNYLHAHGEVGTVESPKQYVSGSLEMKYGVVAEYASDIAFFGGELGRVRCALIGSSDSLFGSPQNASANHASYYYTLKFLNYLADGSPDSGKEPYFSDSGKPPYATYERAYEIAMKALVGNPARLEFLAKTLHTEENLIVATPIFVALDG
jgi:hypothetical protein